MSDLANIKDMSPTPETVKLLEEMLVAAKAGNLRTFVAVCGWYSDEWTTQFAIDARCSRRRLLGQISMAQYEVLTQVAVDNEDSVLAQTLMSMRA